MTAREGPGTSANGGAGGQISEGVAAQLVAMLFDQTPTLVGGGLALAAVGAICWLRTGEHWFGVWSAIALVALAGRLAIEWGYRHRRDDRPETVARWRRRFIAGAWIMGAIWGLAAIAIWHHDEPLVQMFVVSVETVIIMGAAARNASSPHAARVQTVLGLGPLFVAELATDDPYYRLFSIFLVVAFVAAQNLITFLYQAHLRFLQTNEENAGLVDAVRAANAELAALNEQLERAATTDALTGIANRRRFDELLATEVRRAERVAGELALLFLDIDKFKGFNDLYGHQAGDECLRLVAGALDASFGRLTDLVARYGGEEFAVILPATNAAVALELAERCRGNIEALDVRNAASPSGILTVSIGVAAFPGGSGRGPADYLRGADEALYAAKGAGRNRVRLMRTPALT